MASLGVTAISMQQPLTNFQQIVATKLSETTTQVITDIIITITRSGKMSPQAFIETQIAPRQAPLSEIDERTSKFFQKMMKAINEKIDKIPALSGGFVKLASYTGDQQIRKKLIEGIALPTVKRLITNLDSIKSSIIDDMINA